MTKNQKSEWAKILFVREGLSQKEIAKKTGVSESTVSRWAAAENWEKLKISFVVTKQEELGRLYMQLRELNDAVMKRPEGERFVKSAEADTLSKLAAAIRKLETDCSLADIISVSQNFLEWVRKFDLPKAQELSDLFDGFIKQKLN